MHLKQFMHCALRTFLFVEIFIFIGQILSQRLHWTQVATLRFIVKNLVKLARPYLIPSGQSNYKKVVQRKAPL